MISVRLATLADTIAISEIHRSDVAAWERTDNAGTRQPADYEDLSLYERWQHGGPWMSVETCAVHLNRLLAGSGIPLVACLDGKVLAEAEVYESMEPPPFGHHLELSVIATHRDHMSRGLGSALLDYVIEMARLMKCERVTVSDAAATEFYEKHGFRHTRSGHGIRIPTQAGRSVYQTSDLTDRSPEQIKGWFMPLGRYRSTRQEWEKLFPQDWAAGIPELLNIPTAHVKMTASGQNAILFASEAGEVEMEPGDLHIACWSARPMTPMLLAAIRDWAYRKGYRTVVSYVDDSDRAVFGSDAQPTAYTQQCYELLLR